MHRSGKNFPHPQQQSNYRDTAPTESAAGAEGPLPSAAQRPGQLSSYEGRTRASEKEGQTQLLSVPDCCQTSIENQQSHLEAAENST